MTVRGLAPGGVPSWPAVAHPPLVGAAGVNTAALTVAAAFPWAVASPHCCAVRARGTLGPWQAISHSPFLQFA